MMINDLAGKMSPRITTHPRVYLVPDLLYKDVKQTMSEVEPLLPFMKKKTALK